MKKIILSLISIILLISCGKENNQQNKALVIGATPVPHAQILDFVKEDLKNQGVQIQIKEFTDYITPNLALDSKELDVNFFQHKPYLDEFIKDRNLKLSSLASIHIEPIGVYSNKIKSISQLKENDTVAIPNDPTNGGRALILLHNNGIIKLKNPDNLLSTEFDIVDNPKQLKFKAVESAQLPRVLQDVTIAVINSNYALEANLNPTKDAIIIEGAESAYANILAIRQGEENREDIKKLVNVLQSEKVKKFILEKYKGAVVPAF